jgi:hypothetical protein
MALKWIAVTGPLHPHLNDEEPLGSEIRALICRGLLGETQAGVVAGSWQRGGVTVDM